MSGRDQRSGLRDAVTAVRNAFKLGGALMLTWVIGLAARVLLPRYLGPEAFGALNFADAFTGTAFVLVGLGIDTYVRSEVSVREDHASEFFGGTLLLQGLLTLLVFGGMGLLMARTGRPPLVRHLVYAYGLAQVFLTVNATLAAMLHAKGSVDHLALANILSKVLWAVGIIIGFLVGQPAMGVPVSLFLTEAGKTVVLLVLARRYLHLRLRLDPVVTRAVVVASLPFYLGGVATVASSRVDVSLLEFLMNDSKEIGWYGAASTLARLGLILTPLLSWVLMPMLSRARARSEADLVHAISRSMELVLTLAVPVSLALALGADVWVRLLFGAAYAPATLALRILGPVFVMTYVATVSGTCLQLLGRGWTATNVTVAGTVVDAVANLVLIPWVAARHLGPGAAGAASAAAAMLTELVVMVLLTWSLKGRVFDRRAVDVTLRTLLVCALVTGLDRACASLGPWRIALDAAAYLALAPLLGAVRWREIVAFVRSARGGEAAAADAPAA